MTSDMVHWKEMTGVCALAIAAAIAVKLPELFGLALTDENAGFYARNASLFVLPFLTLYFVWQRHLDLTRYGFLAVPFLAAMVFANIYPFSDASSTEILLVLHLPIALWLAIGYAYAGDRWSTVDGRLDFIRFSGELFIYYVLIALGGGVLTLVTVGLFDAIDIEIDWLAGTWVIPCGAVGAVIVGAWLLEAKRGAMGNLAPMLTRLFTPMFTAVMIAFLVTTVVTGQVIDLGRNVLIVFDLLLVLVLGLLLYSAAARDPEAPPTLFDGLQVLMLVSALIINVMALGAVAVRISEWGFSANKLAALGENLVLMVNLSGAAWLYWRFIREQVSFTALLRWLTGYLPVYAIWASMVVIVLPPLFGFR